MDYKPGDFFVGLVDFFSILLPGALLVFLFKDFAAKHVFGSVLPGLGTEAEGWVVFLFAAYLFGQFVQLIGATFMDSIYDCTYLAYRRVRNNRSYERAKTLAGTDADVAGVLKWATAHVRLHNAGVAVETDRFEATSKFFRGLVVVLLAYGVAFAADAHWRALVVTISLMALSFWRFCNQRWKYTEHSYLYFIQLRMPSAETETKADAARAA